jgi:ElaB/YqjD/DUF883 family membrane-anchored ribosome-binding protein
MADETVETAPRTAARRSNGSSSRRSARAEETLEDQVAKLQDDIKAIGASLAKLSDAKVSEARASARSQYRNIVSSGQHVVDDLSDQVSAYEGQLVEAIREKPLTAVLGAVGVGFLIAMLSRR